MKIKVIFNPYYFYFKNVPKPLTSQKLLLEKLLNDESFLRWLKGEASLEEKQVWRRWLLKDSERQSVVEKAQKFLNMPFKIIQCGLDESEQLYRLQLNISEYDKDRTPEKEKS